MDSNKKNETDSMENLKNQIDYLLNYFENPYVFLATVFLVFLICLLQIRLTWKLLKGIWTCFLGYRLGFGVKWRPGQDVYAVITGASDGIGMEYAKQFAKIGYSLLLIARNQQKLTKVKDELLKINLYPKCGMVILCFV